MILVADCGSTKVDWAIVDHGCKVVKRVGTKGMNAVVMSEADLEEIVASELASTLADYAIDRVYFYGAGVVSDQARDKIRRVLRPYVQARTIEVESDLLAAARVLCGHSPGIACIIGTGANSCFFDGERIVDNVCALGYILGDEGSGAVLGRQLVSDVFKRRLPKELCDKFLRQYDLDMATVVQNVYARPGANRFLASLSPFLLENIGHQAIHRLVVDAFKAFFVRNISNYKDYKLYPVNFVGSIAHYYKAQLEEAAVECGCLMGRVVKAPLDGLIEYHRY